MRPFLSISLPEVPSFPEFRNLISLRPTEQITTHEPISASESASGINEQALSILEVADQALKIARKEWDAVSKAHPEAARCVGCEEWWRTSVRNVLRSCITANIMVAKTKKAMAGAGSKSIQDALNVEISKTEKEYHSWWIIPRISSK